VRQLFDNVAFAVYVDHLAAARRPVDEAAVA
jgi:hypothetical protein